MAKNKKKKKIPQKSVGWVPTPVQPKKVKNEKKQRLIRHIIWISVLVCIVLGSALGGFLAYRAHAGFNYIEANLSRYVTLSKDDLRAIRLAVRIDKPTEEDVEREITALLVQHKTVKPGQPDPDDLIANGSVVELYYSGYMLSASGEKEYFSGGSNLSSAEITEKYPDGNPYKLTIGSASFVAGFEEGLVGVRPSDTEIPEIITEGTLAAGDTVRVSIVGARPDGGAINVYEQPLVLTPALDEIYGQGFYEMLVGAELGTNAFMGQKILPSTSAQGGDYMYTTVRPSYKTVGGSAHVVESYFPMNYGQDSLNGKTAYFEVYIKNTTSYVLPQLTDAFLTEKVGVEAESLEDYEGETLVEKYKSFIRETKEKKYEEELLSAAEETFWKKLVEIAEVSRVPRAAVNETYDEYIASTENTYQDYLKNMNITEQQYPFSTFCKEYFSLSDGMNYKDYVRSVAEQTAREKMIFFYAIEFMGVKPSEAELEEAFEESLLELAKQNTLLDESYYTDKTDPTEREAAKQEYLADLEKTKQKLLETAGEEYFLESAYYNLGFPKLIEMTNVTYVGKGHS